MAFKLANLETCCFRHHFNKLIIFSVPREVDQRIHNPDSDSSHNTSESVDLRNLDSTDYGCEVRLWIGSRKDSKEKLNAMSNLHWRELSVYTTGSRNFNQFFKYSKNKL